MLYCSGSAPFGGTVACAEHCAAAVSNTSLGMQGQLGSEISRWESIRARRNMSSIFEAGAGKKAAGQSGKCL